MRVKLIILVIVALIMSCKHAKNQQDLSHTEFVYLKGKVFKHKGQDFFPIMLNYVVSLRNIDNRILISPIKEYENPDIFESNTVESIEIQNKAHLQLIKEMGFNTIRLIFDRVSIENEKYFYNADSKKLSISEDYDIILNSLEGYLKIVEKLDLKVMLLIKAPVENDELEDFTKKLISKFSNNPTIFSYDFFNEPLYFDNMDKSPEKRFREKKEARKIVIGWKKMMDNYAPNQLFTIGFSEPIEVFEWDPEILPVDFVSFHTYNPLRATNEIYWYCNYINKPWMIGETALPADNDSIPYEYQQHYMREIYQRIINCNGAGIGWWEFQEIPNTHFEAGFSGILNHQGITTTKDGKYQIIGTVKPAVKEIANFKNYRKKDCDCMNNYYNMLGYSNIKLKGRIIDEETQKPVEGAVIRGWNENWAVGVNTFSNKNGVFTLFSNDFCIYFEISAPGMSRKALKLKLDYFPTYNHNIKPENLPQKDLEYHTISYLPFMKNKNVTKDSTSYQSFIFNFDTKYFNKSLYQGSLGIISLRKL
jgi:hypothetical protein